MRRWAEAETDRKGGGSREVKQTPNGIYSRKRIAAMKGEDEE
jgi:hypothetical protein